MSLHYLNKNLFLALVCTCIWFWVRFSVMLKPVSFNLSFVFKDSVSAVTSGKLDSDRFWLFAHIKFSFPMTLIYNNICELHQHQHQHQNIIRGFCHNSISILVQTFLYTMYQNAISTGVLFMPVYDTIKILNCFIHISCHFFQFTGFLLLITLSLQFVKFFTIEFYCFDKVSEQVFTFNLVIPSWVTWFILQISLF